MMSRFNVKQFMGFLKQVVQGAMAVAVCSRAGVTVQTVYRGRANYSGISLGVYSSRRLEEKIAASNKRR